MQNRFAADLLAVLQACSPADGYGVATLSGEHPVAVLVGVCGHLEGAAATRIEDLLTGGTEVAGEEGGHGAGALKTVEAHGDGAVELLEQFGVLGAPAEPGHALLLGCTDHVHGGARRGDVLHACGQVDLRGVIEHELEGAGGDVAGGAGAVVLHAAGEVAAVEDRAYVKVAVGDFFTAAVLGGVDHGEGGDAGRCLGCLVALLVVLLSVLRVLGIFGGNLGGDALLVQATGQTGGQHTVAGNAAAVAGGADVLGVGALYTGALCAGGVAVLVFTLVRAVIGVAGAADSCYTGSALGCLLTICRRLRAVRVGHLRGVLTVHGSIHAANTGGCARLSRRTRLSTCGGRCAGAAGGALGGGGGRLGGSGCLARGVLGRFLCGVLCVQELEAVLSVSAHSDGVGRLGADRGAVGKGCGGAERQLVDACAGECPAEVLVAASGDGVRCELVVGAEDARVVAAGFGEDFGAAAFGYAAAHEFKVDGVVLERAGADSFRTEAGVEQAAGAGGGNVEDVLAFGGDVVVAGGDGGVRVLDVGQVEDGAGGVESSLLAGAGVCEGAEGELAAVEEGVEHFGVYARDDVVTFFVVDVGARLGACLGAGLVFLRLVFLCLCGGEGADLGEGEGCP